MCGRNIDRHIICRVLNRSKCINLFPHRKNNDTTRMLSRSTTHPDTSKYDPVNFTVSLMYAALFIIIFDITECRLIRQRTDRSCLKGLSLPEDNFGVFMCLTLVLSGKVQVDIRLFISLKPQERLKRNIKPFFGKRFSAARTELIRHITSASAGKRFYQIRIKIAVLAMFAQIMRMQRVNLRNTGHCRNERTSDRSTRSDQVAVFVGFPNQLLRNDIHHSIPIADNGI